MPQYSRKLKRGVRWYYKFSFQGKTYHSKVIHTSKNEAKRAERKRFNEIEQEALNPSQESVVSLMQAINERLDYVEVKKTEDYYKDNKRYYAILLKQIGDIPITSITKQDIHTILLESSKEAKQADRDNYAINYMLNLFGALFNYAIDTHDLAMRNPCKGIEPFPVTKRIKYIPNDKDIEAVRALCDTEQKLLFDFVSETGARINEPLKVTGKDILDEYVILHTKKSKNSNIVPRKVPKPECITHISIADNERLFSQWTDTPKFLKRKVKILKQRPWNWHNLRHRRASIWNKEGKSLFEIMSLLGHSQLSTTQNYLQLLG